MAKATLAKHPLHPQLIALPLGLLPFSLAMDLMHAATGRRSYARAAYYSMVGGSATALAAGAAGFADYLDLPRDRRHLMRTANTHALLNLAALGLYGLNIARRARRQQREPGPLERTLSACGFVTLLFAGWHGGHLVYHHGVRVKESTPLPDTQPTELPGDEHIAVPFERLAEYAPAGKPVDAEPAYQPRPEGQRERK